MEGPHLTREVFDVDGNNYLTHKTCGGHFVGHETLAATIQSNGQQATVAQADFPGHGDGEGMFRCDNCLEKVSILINASGSDNLLTDGKREYCWAPDP